MPRASATSAPLRLGTISIDAVAGAGFRGRGVGWGGGAVMIVSVVSESMGWSESAAGDAADRDGLQDDVTDPRGHRGHVELRRRHGVLARFAYFHRADLRAVAQHDPAGLDRLALHDRGGLVQPRRLA